ncbi:MAG: peptide ABC transporter substrate-binding protein [Chloroflexi bacterium]|nr:peptide ABC transporter substrate-binding protein [Chloroflexota bacterium]
MLGALLAFVVSAPARSLAQTAPPQEVTVNFLTEGEPDTLDPNRASLANAAAGAVIRQVFEPLLRFDANLVPQPAAAESYEVSSDGLTYTFHLRRDGRWSDGQAVTAAQFAYSWNRLLDPALHADYAPLFASAGITSTAALDDLTFQVRVSQPFGALPDLAALWMAVPLRPDVVSNDPDGWATNPDTLVGNGPFQLTEWLHQDHLTLVPNPQYTAHLGWPKPVLTKITVLMNTDADADYVAYGQNQRGWALVPDAEINHVLNDPSLAAESRQYSTLTTFWLQMNVAHAGLSNVLLRRALSKAIDRVALVRDLAAGVSVPTTSLIPPGMPGFQDGLGHELGFDPAGARALLAQADPPPDPLAYAFPETPADRRRAEYLQAQWRSNLGLDVQLSGLTQDAYQQALTSGDYDLAFGGWNADYPDPRDWFNTAFGCTAPYNTVGYCNAGFDQILARADMATSLADRLPLYAQAQTLLLQDVPVAPLFVRGRLVLIKPWIQSTDGASLVLTPLDDYPGSLFLDKVQILPH